MTDSDRRKQHRQSSRQNATAVADSSASRIEASGNPVCANITLKRLRKFASSSTIRACLPVGVERFQSKFREDISNPRRGRHGGLKLDGGTPQPSYRLNAARPLELSRIDWLFGLSDPIRGFAVQMVLAVCGATGIPGPAGYLDPCAALLGNFAFHRVGYRTRQHVDRPWSGPHGARYARHRLLLAQFLRSSGLARESFPADCRHGKGTQLP